MFLAAELLSIRNSDVLSLSLFLQLRLGYKQQVEQEEGLSMNAVDFYREALAAYNMLDKLEDILESLKK